MVCNRFDFARFGFFLLKMTSQLQNDYGAAVEIQHSLLKKKQHRMYCTFINSMSTYNGQCVYVHLFQWCIFGDHYTLMFYPIYTPLQKYLKRVMNFSFFFW